MSEVNPELTGPGLCKGVPASTLNDGVPLLGHAQGEPMILVRRGESFFAVGAACTHYGGPLAEGLVEGDCVRFPWHHASFSVRTGQAMRAPALSALTCRRVEQRAGKVFVGDRIEPASAPPARAPGAPAHPESIVIVGGGAAGHAAAEMLRREHYEGPVTLLSADDSPPCDRPNLSKSYLAGTAPEDWIPLRTAGFYREHRIDLKLNSRVVAIDTDMVPFFWTEQYDFSLAYVGHAERFDKVEIDGTLAARDCRLSYSRDGKRLAVAVVHRDLEGLRCEVEFERAIAAGA